MGNVGLIFDGEIAVVERDSLLAAVFHKPHQQGLNDADASVIASPARGPVQILEILEYRQVGLGRLDFQACAGIE